MQTQAWHDKHRKGRAALDGQRVADMMYQKLYIGGSCCEGEMATCFTYILIPLFMHYFILQGRPDCLSGIHVYCMGKLVSLFAAQTQIVLATRENRTVCKNGECMCAQHGGITPAKFQSICGTKTVQILTCPH